MAIAVRCESCGQAYELDELFAGRLFQCRRCGGAIRAPAISPPFTEAGQADFAQLLHPQEFGSLQPPTNFGGSDLPPGPLPTPRRPGRQKSHHGRVLWIAAAGGSLVGLAVITVLMIASAVGNRDWFPAPEAPVARLRNKVRPITAPAEGAVEPITNPPAPAYSGPSAESMLQEILAATRRLHNTLSAIHDEATARQRAGEVVAGMEQIIALFEKTRDHPPPISVADSRRLKAIYEPQMIAAGALLKLELNRVALNPRTGPTLAQSLRTSRLEQRFNQGVGRQPWAPTVARSPALKSARGTLGSLHSAMLSNRDPFAQYAEREVAEVVVQKLPGGVAEFIRERLCDVTGCKSWSYTNSGDSLHVMIAPILDVKQLAATIDFGTVTKIDASQSLLVVVADASKLPPPLLPEVAHASHPDFYRRNLDDMSSWSKHRRRAAINRLSDAQPKELRAEIAQAFIRLLGDSDRNLRLQALAALPVWATADEAVPLLIPLLRDSDGAMVDNAIKALAEFKDIRSVGPLCEQANRWGFQVHDALSKFEAPAETEIIKYLNHPDEAVRKTAIKALGDIGTARCVPFLLELERCGNFSIELEAKNSLQQIRHRRS